MFSVEHLIVWDDYVLYSKTIKIKHVNAKLTQKAVFILGFDTFSSQHVTWRRYVTNRLFVTWSKV